MLNESWLMNGDCLEEMKKIPSGSVDLTVTSPPYDNLRSYNGNVNQWCESVWKRCIKELFRVTKNGGVVVWVVGDATIKGSETGTSFKQALYAMECGFNLHDTMIYKNNKPPQNHNRYEQCFEYMFIFSAGKPKAINKLLERCKRFGEKRNHNRMRQDGDSLTSRSCKGVVKEYKPLNNIWFMSNKGNKFNHPAVFPIELANRHILSWSNKGDVVLDCFMGSGTTGVAAVNLNRKFIGIELDDKYFSIAENRINEALAAKSVTAA